MNLHYLKLTFHQHFIRGTIQLICYISRSSPRAKKNKNITLQLIKLPSPSKGGILILTILERISAKVESYVEECTPRENPNVSPVTPLQLQETRRCKFDGEAIGKKISTQKFLQKKQVHQAFILSNRLHNNAHQHEVIGSGVTFLLF